MKRFSVHTKRTVKPLQPQIVKDKSALLRYHLIRYSHLKQLCNPAQGFIPFKDYLAGLGLTQLIKEPT